jgi:glycolate oxidase FAD binding subunit
VAILADALAAAGQECVRDLRDPAATVGGAVAAGVSGLRRLRYGPLRDRVLEVRFVTGDARVVKGGGPTVKNVTGYDLPRLLVGSLGTLGVITRVILRCQPRPAATSWFVGGDPADVRRRCFRPSTILWRGEDRSEVLLEGYEADVQAERTAAGLEPAGGAAVLPDGPHRGRIAVAPRELRATGTALATLGDEVRWAAEWGVGTVHVAATSEDGLAAARTIAEQAGGWLLRERGAPRLDGFGRALPNRALMARIKAGFDPDGKLSPGRMPLPPVDRDLETMGSRA